MGTGPGRSVSAPLGPGSCATRADLVRHFTPLCCRRAPEARLGCIPWHDLSGLAPTNGLCQVNCDPSRGYLVNGGLYRTPMHNTSKAPRSAEILQQRRETKSTNGPKQVGVTMWNSVEYLSVRSHSGHTPNLALHRFRDKVSRKENISIRSRLLVGLLKLINLPL